MTAGIELKVGTGIPGPILLDNPAIIGAWLTTGTAPFDVLQTLTITPQGVPLNAEYCFQVAWLDPNGFSFSRATQLPVF